MQDKDFAYALFEQLAEDFNGDLFPKDAAEKEAVTVTHLGKLRRFLMVKPTPTNHPSRLWAYDFEIVPIELISSIYEEFYKNEQDDPGYALHAERFGGVRVVSGFAASFI